jgi:phage FluMu gp28-like protein
MSRALTTGRILLPFQLRWCEDESPAKLGEKSRQIGWTWTEAYDCVSRRFRRTQPRKLNYWFSSTDESAGVEFIEYSAFFARKLFARIADRFTEEVEAPELRKGFITAHCIRVSEDVKITAMSSNPRRFRGKRGDVRVDEAAFHDDPEGMHDAASPVTQWGGTYATWSTHFGEGSLFNRFIVTAKKIYAAMGHDPSNPPDVSFDALEAAALKLGVSPVFSLHRVTLLDAIAQGLVERINEVTGSNLSREKFLERIRLKARSVDAFNQEYLCIASADATAWLPYTLIESCEHDDVPQPVALDPENRSIPAAKGYTGGPVYVGVDVGRTKDLTYVPFCEKVGDVLWPRLILSMSRMPIPDQVDLIALAAKQFKTIVRACVDYTGLGIGVGDGLARPAVFGPRCENIPQNNSTQEIEAIGLLACMQDKKLRLPAGNQRLRDSLHSVRKEFTATGKPRFVAPKSDEGHADDFWGFALAVHAAASTPHVPFEFHGTGRRTFGGFEGTFASQGVGW